MTRTTRGWMVLLSGMLPGVLPGVLACLLLAPARLTMAQALDETSGEYASAIDEALAEYEAGHFAESRALFERAHAIAPNARTLRGLGMVEFELRNYPRSVVQLERALVSSVRPLEGALRQQTEQLLGRARGFVGRFTVVIDPSEAQLTIDGEAAERDADGALMLAVGDHVLEVRAPGRVSEHRTLRVSGGEHSTLRITLLSEGAVTGRSKPRDEDEGGSLFASPWFWTAVGAIAIGAGVGVGFAVLGNDTRVGPEYGADTGEVLRGP